MIKIHSNFVLNFCFDAIKLDVSYSGDNLISVFEIRSFHFPFRKKLIFQKGLCPLSRWDHSCLH